MKPLLENWRNYQKEALKEFLDMQGHSAPYDKEGQPIDPDMAKAMEGFGREINNNAQLRGLLFGLASTADPTGATGYEDLKKAKKDFLKKPTGASAGWLILALLGSLPVAGLLTSPVRLLKAKRALKNISKVTPVMQKTAGNAELTKKVAEAEAKAVAAVNKVQRATKQGINNFNTFLTKHIVDNIPINKETALNIIKKFPGLGVMNRAVYRGMKVDADYIIKHYGDEIINNGPGVTVLNVSKKFKPRGKATTSSWSGDFTEADVWSQGGFHSKTKLADKPFEIIFVGGKGNKGLDLTAAAKKLNNPHQTDDWAEIAMIGDVNVEKVIIVNRQGLQKGQHVAKNQNLSSGFYPAGSRQEILKTLRSASTKTNEGIFKKIQVLIK